MFVTPILIWATVTQPTHNEDFVFPQGAACFIVDNGGTLEPVQTTSQGAIMQYTPNPDPGRYLGGQECPAGMVVVPTDVVARLQTPEQVAAEHAARDADIDAQIARLQTGEYP